jgi:hypothetical protein
MARNLTMVACLAALALTLTGPLCGRAPSEPLRVVVFPGGCVAPSALLPGWAVAGVRYLTSTAFLTLEPPFGPGDAVAFRKRATWRGVKACCVLPGEYRVEGQTVVIDTDRCTALVSGPESGYERIFHQSGVQLSAEEVAKWEAGR